MCLKYCLHRLSNWSIATITIKHLLSTARQRPKREHTGRMSISHMPTLVVMTWPILNIVLPLCNSCFTQHTTTTILNRHESNLLTNMVRHNNVINKSRDDLHIHHEFRENQILNRCKVYLQ